MSDSNTIYIKALIAKLLKKELTAEEAEELAVERAELSEDEYDDLVVEVLSDLEGQLPEGYLQNWSSGYRTMTKKGRKKSIKRRKFKRVLLRNVAASVIALITVLAVFYIGIKYFGEEDKQEVPTFASSCVIFRGDSVLMEVSPDSVGVLCMVGNLQISRMKDGLIVIDRLDTGKFVQEDRNLVFYTPPRQQCLIELEDGTSIRLNAQSYIKYPIQRKDQLAVYFDGEAYVNQNDEPVGDVVEIRTANGYLVASRANFLIRTLKDKVEAVLEDGHLEMYSYNSKDKVELTKYENKGSIVSLPASMQSAKRDTLVFVDRMDYVTASRWTKEVRDYKNCPLRAYVEEMCRWYGFVVKDWNCFPKDKVINAKVRYDDSMEIALGVLSESGVVVCEEKGLLGFCPEK